MSTRVCGCTPSTADTTSTAPSNTRYGPLHFGDEIAVPGSVDEVDGQVAEHEGRHRGLDGDAAPAFQLKCVGLGGAAVDAADPVDDAGGVEQPLGQAGLAGVNMRDDADVERFCQERSPGRLPNSRLS